MAFHETLEEIEEEMFAPQDLSATRSADRAHAIRFGLAGRSEVRALLAPGGGFHVERGVDKRKRISGPKRLISKRATEKAAEMARIRERLLVGETPRQYRTPVRWFAVAAELGIDLVAVADQKYATHWKKTT